MKKFPALIPTLALLSLTIFLATLNLANANSSEDNPLPFLPPLQHSQSQSHVQLQPPPHQLQPQQQQQQINQQPLNSNEMSNGHKNQFDNRSPTVTSVMPF